MITKSRITSRLQESSRALSEGNARAYWIAFAILFAIMFLCMIAPLFVMGKGFLWLDDGLTQQYTSFIMLGEWYRSLLTNIFVDHSFIVPMWTEATGYGEDCILAISSYIGNPFFLTAIFSDAHNADTFLDISVAFTLIAAGITFTFLARSHWHNGFAILSGCMVYVFSGFTLIAFHQVHMLYPLALCPLVFLGAEWVFQGRKPFLLVISLSLLLFYSLYTGYMCCLLLLIFCVARFLFSEERTARRFLRLFLVMAGSIILAMLISAVFFLPSAIDLLSQDRVSLERDIPPFYTFWYYLRIYEGFLGFDYAGSECFIGFFPIALACLLVLFAMKKNRTKAFLITLFVVLTAILLLPVLGSVFNGFSYPNNRWIWAYSMLVSIITVFTLEQASESSEPARKRLRNVLIAYVAFNILALAFLLLVKLLCPDLHPFGEIKKFLLLVFITLAIFALFLWKGGKSLAWQGAVLSSLVVCCLVTYGMWFLPGWGNAGSRNVTAGQAYEEAVTNTPNNLIVELPGDEVKYDVAGSAVTWRNSGIAAGHDTTSFYNSMYNDAIDAYHSELGLTTSPFNISYESMDARPAMEAMAGVSYVIEGAGDASERSSSFDNLVQEKEVNGNQYVLYETDHVLPLAFIYGADSVEATSVADRLTGAETQNLILNSVLLEETSDSSSTPSVEECEDIPYAISISSNDPAQAVAYPETTPEALSENQPIIVRNGGSTIRLSASIPADRRAYLCVEGVSYEPLEANSESVGQEAPSGIVSALRSLIRNLTQDESSGCTLTATCGGSSKSVWQPSSNTHLYGGKDSWAFNLGTSDSVRDEVLLELKTPGHYSIESLQIIAEDDVAVTEAIANLSEKGASDIDFEWNTLTCNATANSEGDVLFFRLPYSKGWHLTIDGEGADLEKANIGFMGMRLPAGSHEIVLTYETPGIALGALLSLAGIAVFAGWVIWEALRSRARATGARQNR